MIASMSQDDNNADLGKSWISGVDVIVVDRAIIKSDSDLFYGLC